MGTETEDRVGDTIEPDEPLPVGPAEDVPLEAG